MSAQGMAAQALAAEIVKALLADEKDGGFDLTGGLFGPNFSAMVRRWAFLELEQATLAEHNPAVETIHAMAGEPPHAPNARIMDLANRIDSEQLCRRAGIDRPGMTPDQRDRLDAGVMLRRYASLLGDGMWRIFPPRPGFSYRSGTLDSAVSMAKKGEERHG